MTFVLWLSGFLVVINLAIAAGFLWLIKNDPNGKTMIRLLVVGSGLFTAGVYSLVLFGAYETGLPPDLGRPVVSLNSLSIFFLMAAEILVILLARWGSSKK